MKESELLSTWLWAKHRTALQWRNTRLGLLPTKELARMYMVTLRWVDAIFIENGVVHLVEAKLTPQPGAIGQLELYQEIFKITPEFSAYAEWPIKLILLTTRPDLSMIDLLSKKGIDYEIFTYDDVVATMKEMGRPILAEPKLPR